MKPLFTIICNLLVFVNLFPQEQRFNLLSSRVTGIDFINSIRENEALNVLAYEYFYNGGGVAVGDIDNDGLADIYFTANLGSNKLYHNKGGFSFRDITRSSGTSGRKHWKTGVTMADINGDGWLDIYVCYSGKGSGQTRRNELYINNRDLTFTESAASYGLDDEGCSTQAAFFDYDLDGDLDCYILNHNIKVYKNIELHHLKTDYDPLAADRLYRNEGNYFRDVSREAGISGNPISFGLGVAVSDINNDGWPDLYISNDYTEQDYCYINNKKGGFVSREHYMFGHLSQFSMGSDIADINNDGLVDIFTLDMLPADNRRQKLLQGQDNYELYQGMATNGFHFQFMRNMLHLNNGNGTFSETGQLAGISNTDWSWSALFADFDNDGHKDLFVSNGYMRDYTNKDFLKYWGDYLVKQVVKRDSIDYLDIIRMMPVTLLSNYIFRNQGDLHFQDMSVNWGLDLKSLSNGAAYGDLDNDGDLDLVINNINEEASIYRNDVPGKDRKYIRIRLEGGGRNRFGVGAKVWCYLKEKIQFLEQQPGRGYQSSVSQILHVGLGNQDYLDSIQVTWPDGSSQKIYQVTANQLITFNQDDAKLREKTTLPVNKKIFAVQAPLFSYSHLQLEYNDFKRQPLMPVMYSPCGPQMESGDLNGDGLDDIFIGCTQGQSSLLYFQNGNGKFVMQDVQAFAADSFSTTTDVLFFDADKDGDKDIYAVSGGYADYLADDDRLADRLFINNGSGGFSLSRFALPITMKGSKSCVATADIDADGDMDLFVGGRTVPGEYPTIPESYLLINDGTGRFTNELNNWNAMLPFIGMVTDADFRDYNGDARPDLILVGEWMSPMIFLNDGKAFTLSDVGLNDYKGWWNNFRLFDMDLDGDMDLIAGNWGLNSQLKASVSEPIEMISKDFDGNGSPDPILCYYINGISYPFVTRDELLDQLYPMRRKFTSYKSYADATLNDLFTADELVNAQRMKVTQLATSLFENVNGKFRLRTLPVEAQFSPVYSIVIYDLNQDGYEDILLMGNNEHVRLRMGKMDASFGTVLLNNGKGEFQVAPVSQTGLLVAGDVKDATLLNSKGANYLLIGINNGGLLNFKINQ